MISMRHPYRFPGALPTTSAARVVAHLVGALVLGGPVAGCAGSGHTRHALQPTGGAVRFARSRRDFYARRWIRQVRANTPRICAGFVHRERFERYLKYGPYKLEMALMVFQGGEPIRRAGRITGWRGGKLLRTLRKRRKVAPSNNAYVWCGRLQKGGLWKVGAMRFVFTLRGSDRDVDEHLAAGVLLVTP